MQFINLSGLWALTALLYIVALYLMKKRYVDRSVPSTLLWRKTLEDLSCDRPFQKLKGGLLFACQLLMALLLALSVMRPALPGGDGRETTFIFDVSASMNALDGDQTRLRKAVEDARNRVDAMGAERRVSVIVAGGEVQQLAMRETDATTLSRAFDAVLAQRGGAEIAGALSVARAISDQYEGTETYLYSDQPAPEGAEVSLLAPFSGAENRSVLSLAANGESALARINNFGPACRLTVECYSDEVLCDVRKVDLEENGEAAVTFKIPKDALRIAAHIVEKDALIEDNQFDAEAPRAKEKKAALTGADDVFLEKALMQRSGLTVIRASAADALSAGGFSLYIFEGEIPENLPQDASRLLIDYENAGGHAAPLRAADNRTARELLKNMPLSDLAVRKYKAVEEGTPILTADGETVLAVYEENGIRTAVLGFDPHESNLPAKMDFPVLISNLLDWLLPEAADVEAADNIPASESDLRSVPVSDAAPETVSVISSGRELTLILLLLFFGMLFVEWEVRTRGR